MNVMSKIIQLPNLLMNLCSSVLLSGAESEVIGSSGENILRNVMMTIFRILAQLMYFTCKWIMYMIDIIYFYVLQLMGVGSDTTIFDSSRSDPTFKLLLDNKDMVTTYIKGFVGISIILMIVTAIVAIIRVQAEALKESKAKKSPVSDVLKSVLKSIILLILTPLMAILSIIASSVMLQGLYRATNLSSAKSLGARIFSASASTANKYRMYAEQGVRIPIRYYFSEENGEDAKPYTAKMISYNKFPSMEYFNENNNFSGVFYDPVTDEVVEVGNYSNGSEAWLNESYYNFYDRSDDYSPNGIAAKHKILKTHKNEYFAMSDVVGYALDTMEEYYFVTIQELLESIVEVDNDAALETLVSAYNIRLLNHSENDIASPSSPTYVQSVKNCLLGNADYSFIQYTSQYKDGSHTYVHIKNAIDEMEGAKFTIAYKKEYGTIQEEPDIYGDYINDSGTLKEVEKFFYKENSTSRYKKVDLYYFYNTHTQRYEKAKSYNSGVDYYYKIGEDYNLITSQNEGKFYYKLVDGNSYVHFNIAQTTPIFSSKVQKENYMPLAVGVSVNDNATFFSDYVLPSNIITARGIFDSYSYPTAIRRMQNGDIMFYRDDFVKFADGKISDVGTLEDIEAEEDKEEEEDKGFFGTIASVAKSIGNSVKNFVTSIFNPLKLVPDLSLDDSAINYDYTNETKSISELDDGKLQLSYMFSDALSELDAKQYSINLNYLFDPMSINYVVLVLGSVILFKIMVTSVFAVINRALNLFVLILIYPLACATIPLDETAGTLKTGSYAKWSDRYSRLLFSTFGVLLGINFVFILTPVIDSIDFISPENLSESPALCRIAKVIAAPVNILTTWSFSTETNYHLISSSLNKLLRVMFQIAAFSMVAPTNGKGGKGETFYGAIKDIVKQGGEGVLEDSPMDAVKKTLKTATTAFNMMFNPTKAIKNLAEKGVETVKKTAQGMVPGGAIINEGKERMKQLTNIKGMDDARKELLKALKGDASKDEVNSKLEKYKSTHDVK